MPIRVPCEVVNLKGWRIRNMPDLLFLYFLFWAKTKMCFVLYNNVGQSCFDKAKVQSLPPFPCLFNYVQFFIFNYIFIWLLLSFEVHFVYCYPSWLFILFLCGSRAVVVEYLCSLKKEKIHCASPQEFLFMFSFLFPILYI